MKSNEFIYEYSGLIEEALFDFKRWFDEGCGKAKRIDRCIKELNDLED